MKIYKIPDVLSCIIFDIDSTLYTNDAYAKDQISVQIRHFAKLRNQSYEQARDMIESHRTEYEKKHLKKLSLGNALVNFGISIAESVKWRETLIEPAEYLDADERLESALTSLSKHCILIAVTNNPVLPARKTLEALGVSRLFPHLIGLDTTGVSKPHVLPFTMAAEKAGVSLAECLSVGDRYDIDIALPLELGMGGILVDGVADVYELPAILVSALDGEKR